MIADQMVQRILDRLARAVTDLAVEAFPDDPANYRLTHPNGAILIAYGGSQYAEPRTLDRIIQDRQAEFDLTLILRHLRGPTGAWTRLDGIRLALTGARVDGGGSRLRPVRDRFVSHDNGLWRFEMTLTATVPAIERVADPVDPPLVPPHLTTGVTP